MTDAPDADAALHREPRYELRVEGHLSDPLVAAFPNATGRHRPDGTTVLCVTVADQAALHAVLRTVRDLGLTLRHVARCGRDCHRPPT